MMVKRLNLFGKSLYCFTAFFPLYLYWGFIFYNKIESFRIENLTKFVNLGFIISLSFSIISLIIFYGFLIKKSKQHDKEILIKNSEKDSKYMQYFVGSLSPFIMFFIELLRQNKTYDASIILGSIVFVVLGIIFIFKDEYGILYNLFFIPYKLLNVIEKNNNLIVISKQDHLSGHVKVNQLNKKVFIEWN